MANTWLIFEVNLPSPGSKDILLMLVKPLLERFGDEIQTYHHFFEPQLLVRVRADERTITNEIIPFIDQKAAELGCRLERHVDSNYEERRDFGNGWDLALKFFEIGSRAAILKLESNPGALGPKFDQIYFSHLLLNEMGRTWREEWSIHFDEAIGRLALDLSKNEPDLSATARRIVTENLEQLRKKAAEIEEVLEGSLHRTASRST